MILFEKGSLRVRELTDNDASLLAEWLSNPTVLQYYEGRDRPHDLAMVRESFFQQDDETKCIIEYASQAIGYIQFYELDDEAKKEYGCTDKSGKIYGTDQFIGEASMWNQGIGKQLVRSMVEYLIQVLEADKIVMDPQTWNTRAIACYEQCGFKKIKLLLNKEWHEGEYRDCWLMEYSI